MILTKELYVKISNNQIKYYKSKGYDVKGGNEIIKIDINDLPNNSGQKIDVKCDICNNEKTITMNRYYLNTKNRTSIYTCSRKCAEDKNKETLLLKYGIDNISKLESIKKKKIETCIDNHCVKFPQQSKDINNKSKNTKLQRYGDKNYNNSIKRNETNLKRYGFISPLQNNIIKEKNIKKQFNYNRDIILEKYKYLNIVDFDENDKYLFKCDCGKDHNFNIDYKLLWNRTKSKTILCTICNEIDKKQSGLELQLINFIKKYVNDLIISDRKILKGKELDIYLPELNLAFEFNGLYWHSELYKDENYHLNKTEECLKHGIQLIHIWEDNWVNNKDIVKSMILSKIKKNSIFVSDIKEIDNLVTENFLIKNHLKGYLNGINIGLYYKGSLISLMVLKKNGKDYEILRHCNKNDIMISNSFSILIDYFKKNYNYNNIYIDIDRSNDTNINYENDNFEILIKTKPNCYYINNNIRTNIKLENSKRIYDSGNFRLVCNK